MTDRSPLLFLLFAGPVRLAGRLVPFMVALALVVVANLPISFSGGLLPAPVLALIAVYFWALARPSLMPPYAVLAIGLAEDLLSGGPPGLWATGFLAGYVLIDRQRKDLGELNGAGNLVAFTAVMLLSAITAYVLACAIFVRLLPVAPLLLEGIVTVALYPLLERPLDRADRSITRFLRSG